MSNLEVISPGLYTSVQDFGRFGYRKYGVPLSGVMDQYSASLANLILNNPSNSPLLEITISGPKLKFNCNTLIAISGADISPSINNIPIKINQAIKISEGSVLSFGKLNFGCRAYLAVKDGFKGLTTLGSLSMYEGVTKKSMLKKGNKLAIQLLKSNHDNSFSSIRINNEHFKNKNIDVFKGPEFQKLNQNQKDLLFSSDLIITPKNNRMGYQLDLPGFSKSNIHDMLTSSVMPGTVQLTPSGKIIVLMKDCQTTGGYPRILQLTEESINRLAQKNTGDRIKFKLMISDS